MNLGIKNNMKIFNKLLGLILIILVAIVGGRHNDLHAAVFHPTSFTLANGMRVVLISNHRAPIVIHMVWYKAGSADELKGKTGVAHFLEHLMFKATRNLKSGEFSKIVARNGGTENAFTSFDYTGYHQTVASDRLEYVIKMEADRMRNLIINPKEVESERQVVREERRARTENSPGGRLLEKMNAALYLNYPYRNPIIGWDHEILALTVEDLRRFYDAYYWPNNAILVVAGDITAEKLRPLAEKYYGRIPAGKLGSRIRPKEPPQLVERNIILRDPSVRQPIWRRAYLAPSRLYGDVKHSYPLEVLSQLFGGGNTSRLYRSLVIKQKIALSTGSFYDANNLGPSNFVIFAIPQPGVGISQIKRAVEVELGNLLEKGVTEDELRRAKMRMRAGSIYARDSLGVGARVLGAALSSGQTIKDVESWPERIGDVTADQIKLAADSILKPGSSVTGLLLPAQIQQKQED